MAKKHENTERNYKHHEEECDKLEELNKNLFRSNIFRYEHEANLVRLHGLARNWILHVDTQPLVLRVKIWEKE